MQIFLLRLKSLLYRDHGLALGWRRRRMTEMVRLVGLNPNARIIDLGGTPLNWQLIDHTYQITLVNLPGTNPTRSNDTRYRFVDGDACDLRQIFADKSFDFVFSNSTIEHVGNDERQEAFASEVMRLGHGYWVQTPSTRSIVEPHTGLPLYWQLPNFVKNRLHRSWESKLPAWYEMIATTRVLSRKRMQKLFPRCSLFVERVFGLEKSYATYRRCDTSDLASATSSVERETS